MVPNCAEACGNLGDVAGLPLDPRDDKYEKLNNDKIADEVGKSTLAQLNALAKSSREIFESFH